jgi:hypothetical protein
MRYLLALAGTAAMLATPLSAAPGDRVGNGTKKAAPQNAMAPPTRNAGARTTTYSKPSTQPAAIRPASPTNAKPAYNSTKATGNNGQTRAKYTGQTNTQARGNNDITINNNNNINVSGNNRYPNTNPNANRYPVYQTPNGGYYRPPNGGYYRPPPPPPGGWGGGYYPPPSYFYDDGPSVGDVIAGVAVAGSLIYLLTEVTKPKQQTVVVQGGPPPMPPPPQPYVPPKNSTGAPALVNVDINGLTPAQRPSASVCITEAARQIGATGGTEIRVKQIVDVEEGNGGYRFRLVLLGVYPDETRTIPMYCRATPEKIVELTFG